MIIVLDTNVWLTELGLNSGSGAAFRFFVRRRGAQLALPEVVRLEVVHNLRSQLGNFALSIRDNHRKFLAIFGQLKELVLPSEAEIDQRAEGIFATVEIPIREVPFSLENARYSLLMTIKKLPPSDKTQEFKDGVIWSNCCELSREDEVWFVSNDKAFYKNRNYSDGLDKTLAMDASNTIRIFPRLEDTLSELKSEQVINELKMQKAFLLSNKESAYNLLERNGFSLTGTWSLTKSLFVTESPSKLYAKAVITLDCEDIRSEGRTQASLYVEGDCTLDVELGSISELRILDQRLEFLDADGGRGESKNAFLFANTILGHRNVAHSVRYPLD